MQSDPNSALYYRTKGWDFIERGQELFNDPQKPNDKKKGYLIFKKGLECMLNYAKREPNHDIVDKIRNKMNEWLKQAKEMELVVYPPGSEKENIDHHDPFPINSHDLPGPQPSNDKRNDRSISPRPRPKSPITSPSVHKKKLVEGDNEKMVNNLNNAIITEKPNISWDDIAGLEQAKRSLQEAVIYPIRYPNLFEGMRTPWKGILLYGPPGTGKTFLAKACASEADSTFFSVSAADLMSKFVGESEKLIKTMFKMARESKPAIIFIDEIDSLLSARSDNENEASKRVKTKFLVEMQGVGNDDAGILVLGATNIPWVLDPAVRRRFEKRIYIPLPDIYARHALFVNQLSKTPNALHPEDLDYLCTHTEGYSGADINILIRDACYGPLRKVQVATHFMPVEALPDGRPIYQPCDPSEPGAQPMNMLDIPGDQLRLKLVSMEDFGEALKKTKPSVSQKDLKQQEEFTQQYGIEG